VFKGRRPRIAHVDPQRAGRTGNDWCSRTRDLTRAWLWIGPMSSVSKGPESHRVREERDLAVSAEAIMTRTAATTIAVIHRTQSMPGLPLPPNAV
jgi:hypothetical protein